MNSVGVQEAGVWGLTYTSHYEQVLLCGDCERQDTSVVFLFLIVVKSLVS